MSMISRIIGFFILFKLFIFSTFGNHDVILKQISIDQKLPGVSLQSIYQDHYGIMWFGIESIGLCKYDGQEYVIYENNPDSNNSISNNFPLNIIEDNKGNIWVATTGGLNKFDRTSGTFKRFYHEADNKNSLTDNYVTEIHQDRFGYLWIATTNGLSKYHIEKNQFHHVHFDNDSTEEKIYISFIHEDRDGNIWIGSWQKGLFKIDANTNLMHSNEWDKQDIFNLKNTLGFEHIMNGKLDKNVNEHTDIRSICEDNDGNHYIGTSSGIFFHDKITMKIHKISFKGTTASVLDESIVSNLLIDRNNKLWIGTASNGLAIYNLNNKNVDYLSADNLKPNGLKSNSIRSLIEDKSGLIWIGTKFQGIHIYDPRQNVFDHITASSLNGLSNNFVLCITEDVDKTLWIGTKEGGLNKMIPGKGIVKTFKNDSRDNKTLQSNRIEMILEENERYLWLATENSLEKFDKVTETFKHYGNYHIKCLAESKNNSLWIGTNMFGLLVFDKNTEKFIRHESKHSDFFQNKNYVINVLEIDKSGYLWIGTGTNGLYRYNIEKDELLKLRHDANDEKSISGNMIRSFFEDSEGRIWIGTKSDGLNILSEDGTGFDRISEKDGMPSNTIYSILEDSNGNFWLGTHNGIAKYSRKNNEFENFSEIYGLQGKIFEINAHCKASNGIMYFGGSNGLNYFDPLKTKRNVYKAPVIISSIKVYDKIILQDITEDITYRLSYNDKYISFNYALLDYSSAINNQYSYKLTNFDTDYIHSGNRHYASYTSLPPGEYEFHVMGSNIDNTWNKEGVRVTLIIPAPFWKKSWFIMILVLLVSMVILSLYLYRVSLIRKNEKYLLQVVKQKTKDLTEANTVLGKQKEEIEKHNTILIEQSNQISLQNDELEQHRNQLEKLVTDRTIDLEIAKKKAEDSDKLKSAFLANMSHEIRTPLNAIVGFSDLLGENSYTKDELSRITNLIKSNSNSLLQLINDIIDISKIEANQLVITNEEFNLNALMYSLFNSYQAQMAIINSEKSLDIKISSEIDGHYNSLIILSDSFRIEQVFNNLFSNAVKFTRTGEIKMGYEIDDKNNNITFFMSDTGIGIAPQHHQVVFDRFRKIEDNNEKLYRGTGLGLSICSNLIELMGGRMWVESRINSGAKFYFSIPLLISKSGVTLKSMYSNAVAKTPDWSEKSVLIVEDEESNIDVLTTMLRKTNIKVTSVTDGIEAVDIVCNQRKHFDIILMDIKLPRMNGMDATRRIKENGIQTPVVAQTAYAMHEEEKEIMKIGFSAYITKPILRAELFEKIQQNIL